MFFKRTKRDAARASTTSDSHEADSIATMPEPLNAAQVRRIVEPDTLAFTTTRDLEPISGLIGQERALKAIHFGADIKAHDFNMFVLGPPASGKSTAVKAYLHGKTAEGVTPPDDWVYVNNFLDPNRPRALSLPPGRAGELAKAMLAAIDELRATLPAAFEAEDYQVRARTINEEFSSSQDEAFEALNSKASSQNIAILKTPTGFTMAPMSEGKVVKPETFNGLPEDMRKQVEAKIEALQKELVVILERMPKLDKARRAKLDVLNKETGAVAVSEALREVRLAFKDLDNVSKYLDAVESDLVANAALFLKDENEPSPEVGARQSVLTMRDPRFRRYMVNVMVSHKATLARNADAPVGVPIVEEDNPTYGSLIGRIEHLAEMGTLVTDFLLIKSGALHRANGGYLLLDARKVLLSPFTWEALKRTIKGRSIRIEQPAETQGFATTQSLDPEPIPLHLKVILFGEAELYYRLAAGDPEFSRLFKVQADFDDSIARSPENDLAYARLIGAITLRHGLKPVDASGVARMIDEGARLADDQEKLSIEIGRIADILREADYWAGTSAHEVITRDDVAKAITEHMQRSDRLRDKSQESIERGIVLVDTGGEKIGQINGLSVLQLGDFAFGRPTRITARARPGRGRVTDIERESHLGGALHSKGVMILWGFLAGRYALDVPLALAASLVFEQSYGGVDGDSASSTELYALMSALAEVPIRQSLAVTGSVNQRGEVQAIGGVNEKIEGFYDVCLAGGLSGDQGVIIPKANGQNLMLREDLVQAIDKRKFAVHAISHVDQGIEILTGVKAGRRGADGRFPAGTINRLIEDKLRIFAERARALSAGGNNSPDGDRSIS